MEKTMTSNAQTSPAIGEKMPDGTVFGGISPDTGRPMFVTPADAPGTRKWNDAMAFAARFDGHGHNDWRAPSENELTVLFNNRAAIGGFVTHGLTDESWYWTSQQDKGLQPDISAISIRFDTGAKQSEHKYRPSALRCVRG
jgi:hypothetical protein